MNYCGEKNKKANLSHILMTKFQITSLEQISTGEDIQGDPASSKMKVYIDCTMSINVYIQMKITQLLVELAIYIQNLNKSLKLGWKFDMEEIKCNLIQWVMSNNIRFADD